MPVAFTNQASTTLSGGITALATSLSLATTTGANFPATSGSQWFYLTLTDKLQNWTKYEIVKVTTRSGDTCSVIVRAQDGTTAQAWASGDFAQLRLTKGTFADLTVQYANNADNLSNLASAATARTNLGLGSMAVQAASAVAITGGTISGVTETGGAFNGTVGATTPSTGAFTTVSATGQITSTLAIGTAPLVITSTTVVGNLNVSQLLGATWTAPGAIGSVTPSSGAFTTLSASSTVSGAGFAAYLASPPAIGGGVAAAGTFAALNATTIRAVTSINMRGLDNFSATNSGFGEGVLAANAGGTNNTAVGNNALAANTTGLQNTAVGYQALTANTTGQANVALGDGALRTNKTGYSNVAAGYASLSLNVSGTYNIAVGYTALQNSGKSVTAGAFVPGLDYTIQTSGTTNFTLIGAADNNPGTIFTCTGAGVGTGTASSNISHNIGIGFQALQNSYASSYNIALGYNSLSQESYGVSNVAIGKSALSSSVSGNYNVAIGESALAASGGTTAAGAFVVGISYTIIVPGTTDFTLIGAANSNFGTVFTASGVGVGTGVASINNNYSVAVGYSALRSATTGYNNTAVGANALYTSVTGIANVAIGYNSLTSHTTGISNSALGVQSLNSSTTASNNTAAGYQAGLTLTTGGNNTLIGAKSDVTSNAQTNSTALGYQATATIDNQVVFGNASVVQYLLPGTAAHVSYAGSYSSKAPVTETAATHTVAIATSSLICNRAGTITVTLPSAATYPGRELRIRTITANTVVSNASNVVPLAGGAAGTAICAGVAGSFAMLHSDGTNWQIMMGV